MTHARARAGTLPVSALVALLLACGDDPAGPPGPDDFTATVIPAAQWPGEDVTLRWGWLAGHDPVLAMGDSTLTWTRVDDSTASVRLPMLWASGVRQIELVPGQGARRSLASVTMPGNRAHLALDLGEDCVPYAWPRSAPNGFLGCAPGGELSLVAPDGTAQDFPGVAGDRWGLGFGTSYRESVILTPGTGPGEVVAWDLAAASPALGPLAVTSIGGPVFELGPDRWLLVGEPQSAVVAGADTTWLDVRTPRRVVFSPDAQRAVLLADSTAGGVAIVDIAAGAVAHVAGVHFAHKAAFSADGTKLWLAGGTDFHDERIYRVDPAAAAVLTEVVPPGLTIELMPDPAQPFLYAAVDVSDGYYLHVLDPGTLGSVAVIGVDIYGRCGGCSLHHAAYLDPAARRLHTLDYASSLWTFDLLP